MRFYHRTALALLFFYLLQDNVLGAPKARYMWVKCSPDSNDSNCVQHQGPWIDYPGPSDRLPPSAAKDMVSVESSEHNPETETEELSGDSSGDQETLMPLEKNDGWMNDGLTKADLQVEEPAMEEGSGEIDYSNYIFPQRLESKLSAEDLKKDNMIQ